MRRKLNRGREREWLLPLVRVIHSKLSDL
jgi:hypothetical protein